MAQRSQSLRLEHLRVFDIEDIHLLLVELGVVLFLRGLVPLGSFPSTAVSVGTQRSDFINTTNSARAVSPRRDALLPDSKVLLLKLVDFFVLAFELPGDEHLLGVGLDSEQVVICSDKLLELDLIQAERGQASQVVVGQQC